MIVCPICESENEVGQLHCLLCGGDLPQPIVTQTTKTPLLPVEEAPRPPKELTTPNPPPPAFEADGEQTNVPRPGPAPGPAPGPQVVPPSEPPPPGTLCLIVYFQRRPANYFPVIYDEILIGRTDPASNSYPDLDVTPYDPELAISRKHAYLYREGDRYFIYPISNSGTQVNQEMVDIGVKKQLKEGDVIILSGRLAIRFAPIPSQS